MNRKFVGGLLINLFILFLLIILSLFIHFGKVTLIIYSLFIIELFFFAWLYTRKVSSKLFFRHFIGFLIISFFLLLIAVILSLFIEAIPVFIYYLFVIDVLILIVLYIRKKLKREITHIDKIGYAISILIPLIIISYVVYMNWLPFGYEKDYFLDVGSGKEFNEYKPLYFKEDINSLSPSKLEEGITYRSIKSKINYFFLKNPLVPLEKDTEINVFIKFRDNNLSEQSKLNLGLRNTSYYVDGEYNFKTIYDKKSLLSLKSNPEFIDKESNIRIVKEANWFIFDTIYYLNETDVSNNKLQFVLLFESEKNITEKIDIDWIKLKKIDY